jgi:hypothetical protein
MGKRGPITAAELIQRLNSDSDWQREHEARERLRAERAVRLSAEMTPELDSLNVALREAGFEFETIADFVNTDQSYPGAILIFLRHLPRVEHQVLRQLIARALTVREARGIAGHTLISELRKKGDETETKWTLANALTEVSAPRDREALQLLLQETLDEGVRERLELAARNALKRDG